MVRYRSHLLVGGALVASLLVALPIVRAVGRSNPRDFPDSTFCPFNLGFQVDPVTGVVTPTTRPARLTFTAEKAKAQITLVACDAGLTGEKRNPDPLNLDEQGLDISVRNFAVVREDIYLNHQRINPDPNQFSCNISQDNDNPFANTVGSVFDPSVAPAVAVNSKLVPFFDDFGNLATSNLNWKLDGAELVTLPFLNDPIDSSPPTTNALVLARGFTDVSRDLCTSASVKVSRLKPDTFYVVDFRWSVSGIQNPPDVVMLTYVDTNPKE
jgi:hypothetical protein